MPSSTESLWKERLADADAALSVYASQVEETEGQISFGC